MTHLILLCPVCCSPVDATDADTDFECETCGQTWSMKVDVGRISRHSAA